MSTDDKSYAFADLMDNLFAGVIAQYNLPSCRESFEKQRARERIERANEYVAFDMVKQILETEIDSDRLFLNFAMRHSSVLLDNKVSKSICRFYLSYMKSRRKYITIRDVSGKHEKIFIDDIADISQYAEKLVRALQLVQLL